MPFNSWGSTKINEKLNKAPNRTVTVRLRGIRSYDFVGTSSWNMEGDLSITMGADCTGNCAATCTATCSNTCQGSCGAGCSSSCTTWCTGGCSGKCTASCADNCQGPDPR